MRNYLIFGNVNSADYGVWISGGGTFNKPSRRVEVLSVPGRNGDLTIDEGCYNNVTVTYDAFISRGFEHRFHDFMAAMMSQTGYQRLQDTYDHEHFRQAVFMDEMEPEAGVLNRTGKFELSFNCMPQRFLVSGDEWIDVAVGPNDWGVELDNPTRYKAIPVIRTVGAGLFTLSAEEWAKTHAAWDVEISNPTSGSLPSYIDIDGEMEECYYLANPGAWNQTYQYWNNVVTFDNAVNNPDTFPMLFPGKSSMGVRSYGNIFTSLQIKPRWWEL